MMTKYQIIYEKSFRKQYRLLEKRSYDMVLLAINHNITKAVIATAQRYPCIFRVGIFGSYARGEDDSTSDIDLLYDYDDKSRDATHQFLSFVEDFLDIIKPLDADFICLENLLEMEDNFMHNVLNDVIWVYDSANAV